MERIRKYDIIKGIAMLFVIWGHISTIGFNFIYSFHMPVFFIVSGFFFRQRDTKEILKNGIKRLLVPYTVICALAVLIRILFNLDYKGFILSALWGSGSSLNTALYFSHIPNIGPIWFLLAMFWSWITFHFIIKIKNQKQELTLIAILFFIIYLSWKICLCSSPLVIVWIMCFTIYVFRLLFKE